MKKILRNLIGVAITTIGLLAIFFCGCELLRGQWLWIIPAIAACAVVVAGWRLIIGDRPKDILQDLLFVFFRSH